MSTRLSPAVLPLLIVALVLMSATSGALAAMLMVAPAHAQAAAEPRTAVCEGLGGLHTVKSLESKIAGFMTEQLAAGRSDFTFAGVGTVPLICSW